MLQNQIYLIFSAITVINYMHYITEKESNYMQPIDNSRYMTCYVPATAYLHKKKYVEIYIVQLIEKTSLYLD